MNRLKRSRKWRCKWESGYNLISAVKRLGLPEAYHKIGPKRLRFQVLNTLARLVDRARERLLKCASTFARQALDRFRVHIHVALAENICFGYTFGENDAARCATMDWLVDQSSVFVEMGAP